MEYEYYRTISYWGSEEKQIKPTDNIRYLRYDDRDLRTIAQIRSGFEFSIEPLNTEESIKRQIKIHGANIDTDEIKDIQKFKLDMDYKEPFEITDDDDMLCDICMSKRGCEGLKCSTCKNNNNICIDCFNSLPNRSCDVFMCNFDDEKIYKIGEWDNYKYLYKEFDKNSRYASQIENNEGVKELLRYVLASNKTLYHQNKLIKLDNKQTYKNRLGKSYNYNFKCPFCRSNNTLNVSKMSKDEIIEMTWYDLSKLKMKEYQVHNNENATRYEILRDLHNSIPICTTKELREKLNRIIDNRLFKKNTTTDDDKIKFIDKATIEEQSKIIKELQEENRKIKEEYNNYINDINNKLPNFNNCINALEFIIEYNKTIIHKTKALVDNSKGKSLKKELNKIFSKIDIIKIEANVINPDGTKYFREITNI